METEASEGCNLDVIEAQRNGKRGGWITFPFISGSTLGLGLAISGAGSNLIVYLIREYNVKSIDAAQISNIINGSMSLAPVAGAIVSDAYFGCYPVVAFSSAASFLSLVLFTLTAALPSLRPSPCSAFGSCESPSPGQFAALYGAVFLMAIATGGTRFTTATMGANQFDRPQERDIFFNWYFIFLYGSSILGATVIVYVQDTVSWALGFGLSTVGSAVGVVVLLLGGRYYKLPAAQGSPFVGLARVVVAAVRKSYIDMTSPEKLNYYTGAVEISSLSTRGAPSQSFSILNRAAVITDGDTHPDGTVARPWHLCSTQEVSDLKSLLRILPLWSSSIFLSISIGIQGSLTVLQALTVDRHLGPHFILPAGSLIVSSSSAVVLSLFLLDRLLIPLYHALTRHTPTPLQRIGVGHVLNAASMVASALVERRRESIARSSPHVTGAVVPMSVLWLVMTLAVSGVGEAFQFPGQVAFYYQEFPESLRSTATGMIALIVSLGFYLSTAVIGLVRRVTTWLPDDINQSKLENVYWMLVVVGGINFGYYLLCSKLYKYRTATDKVQTAAD
ncbi:protein NRT1/ PTR FAMILY 2.7-like [Typha latifolia]|uniref:protein NRT1/ PTR FAMILY 2.7-like n=1 Tax=Typha latifolia TaxID=4733 RepID=UPI003C2B1968